MSKQEQQDYQLIVKFPIKAVDNVAARIIARDIMTACSGFKDVEQGSKLQRVVKNAPPVGVDFAQPE